MFACSGGGNVIVTLHLFFSNNTNNNVHLSCAHQRPEHSRDTYEPKYDILYAQRTQTYRNNLLKVYGKTNKHTHHTHTHTHTVVLVSLESCIGCTDAVWMGDDVWVVFMLPGATQAAGRGDGTATRLVLGHGAGSGHVPSGASLPPDL